MLIEETVADRKRAREELDSQQALVATLQEEKELLEERLHELEDQEEMAAAGMQGPKLVDSGKLAAEVRGTQQPRPPSPRLPWHGSIGLRPALREESGCPRRKNRSTGGQTHHVVIVDSAPCTRRNRGHPDSLKQSFALSLKVESLLAAHRFPAQLLHP